jgi:hypothetical protein
MPASRKTEEQLAVEFRECSRRAALLARKIGGGTGLLIGTSRGAEFCEPLLDYELRLLRKALKWSRKAAAHAEAEYDAKSRRRG